MRRTVFAALIALSFSAPDARGQIVRDSAGVRLVHNVAPLWDAPRRWRLSASPVLVLGEGQRAGDDEFEGITGLVRLGGGEIVVADGSRRSLRVFAADGRFLRSIGRAGQGPGEFTTLLGLELLTGDTIVALNSPGPPVVRAILFTAAGEFLRQIPIWEGTRTLSAPRPLRDGSMVGWRIATGARGAERTGAIRTDSMELVQVRGESVARSLGRHPYRVSAANASGIPASVVHAPRALVATHGDQVHVAFGDRATIRSIDARGRVSRVVSRPVTRRVVPPGSAASYRAAALRSNPPPDSYRGAARAEIEARRMELLRDLRVADHLPEYNRLLGADSGEIWAERYVAEHGMPSCARPACIETVEVPTEWDVFDSAGRWLGTVAMPARFTPLVILAREVLGIARDVEGVELVHLYRLDKP